MEGGAVMSQKRKELEVRIAATRALEALLEAGRYSRHGLSTAGRRVNRRAVAAGAEGARRGSAAWSALRGETPPPRRLTGIVVAVIAGGAAALGIREGVVAWRAAHPEADVAGSLRRVLRSGPPGPAPRPAAGPAAAEHLTGPASVPDSSAGKH
jgi:hypothetical protein